MGYATIHLDSSSLPEGYEPTTSTAVEALVRQNKRNIVYFGAGIRTKIKGTVVNDLNRNDEIDSQDKGMANVLIRLEDGASAFTDSFGYYTLANVAPGEHILSVVLETLPKDVIIKPPHTRKVLAEEGSVGEVNIYGYSLRAIKGTAYLDVNNNGKFDKEDRGIEGAEIRCAGKTSITDEKGNYLFKDLPSGDIIVSFDEKDKKITLPEDAAIIEGIDFILGE